MATLRIACLLILVGSGAARAQDVDQAADAPGFHRPGIGFAADVLPAGAVAFEQGLPDVVHDKSDGVRSTLYVGDSLLRVGVGGDWELHLAADSFNTLRVDGHGSHQRDSGGGDMAVAIKRALPGQTNDFQWSLLASATFATGASAFRGPGTVYNLGVSAQWTLDDAHDVSLYLARDMGAARSWLFSPSYGIQLGEHVGTYVEAGIGHGSDFDRSVGTGLTWAPVDRVQLDISVSRGFRDTADWQGGFGVSVLFP